VTDPEHHVPDVFDSGSSHTIGASLTFDVRLGPDERRGADADYTPHEVKERLVPLIEQLHATGGLTMDASYAVDSYLTVADGFEADGLLVQAVDCLTDLIGQLAELVAARAGAPPALISTDADLLPYRDRHNLHVVDDRYLTGAQPTERGYRWLRSKGVSTVISLRLDATTDRQTVQELGMEFLHIAWADEQPPSVAQVQQVLAAVAAAPGRVFQHCLRGIGRDLTMSGCYQVATGHPVEQVLAEAKAHAPRWELDQHRDPDTGEPVQFQLLRCFAAARLGFEAVDDELIAASRTLGVPMSRTFWRVVLPLAGPAVLTGMALGWARALGEFGATLVFAGNLPGTTQTLPLAIYVALESDLATAVAIAVLLLGVAVVPLVGVQYAGTG